MEFGILGPLEVSAGSEHLQLHGYRQRIIVATLLLNANRPITTDRLIESVYGADLPPTARPQVQNTISSLRALFAAYGSGDTIATSAHGYVIHVSDGDLDSKVFEDLVTSARTAAGSGTASLAVARFRDALRLWRGPALDGLNSQFIQAAAARLNELRVTVTEDCITLELEIGRHHELICELTQLAEHYPLRERLRGQLMTALYRCGRAAEALEVYRQARQAIVADLGIEPGEQLRRLEHAILTNDPSLDPPNGSAILDSPRLAVPNLLPAAVADFTGRERQIAQIQEYLIDGVRGERRPIPVVVLMGQSGIGKTTLAVHMAHRLADHFRDGLLFADLHGSGSHQVTSAQVLERFLRALGVPGGQVPEDIDERAEMYRNLVAGRRILVVLDDATAESRIPPLLPGSGSAGVIVTSRGPLAALAGAQRVELDIFDAGMSVELLANIAGRERVRAQPEAAAEVARYCGHLPLALRIAGARLVARPHWSIRQLADRLTDESRRLDELKVGDVGVRPSISLTYDSNSAQARKLFRRLALLEMPVFAGWLSAALLDEPAPVAGEFLDELVESRLIEPAGWMSGLPDRYRFHDLVRVFARERLAVEEPAAQREAALRRTLGALLYLADQARRRYYGTDLVLLDHEAPRWPLPAGLVDELVSDPLTWYDHARIALVSGVRQAAQAGFIQLCWNLAASAVPLFESKTYLDDWRETHEVALDATRMAGDLRGQAVTLYHLGSLHLTQLQFECARGEFEEAEGLFQAVSDPRGIAMVVRHLATLDRMAGNLADAERRYKLALSTFQDTDNRIGVAYVMHGMAHVRMEQNRPEDAIELLSNALQISQEAPYYRLEAQLLHRMGEAYLLCGDLGQAADAYHRALSIAKDVGDLIGESYALQGLGVASVRSGKLDQGRRSLEAALEIAAGVGDRMVQARTLLGFGELALAGERSREAVTHGERAAAVFRSLTAPLYEAHAFSLLSTAYAALGDTAAAASAAAEAERLHASTRARGSAQ